MGVVGCGRKSVTAYWKAELVSYVLGWVQLSWVDSILAEMAMKMHEVENEELLDRRTDV